MKRNKEGQIMKRGGSGFEIGAGMIIIIKTILSNIDVQEMIARKLTGKSQYTIDNFANIFISYIVLRSFSEAFLKSSNDNTYDPNKDFDTAFGRPQENTELTSLKVLKKSIC